MTASAVLAPPIQLPMVLDECEFSRGVSELAQRDADLADVVERYGPPPLWVREPGFATLVYIILEQQVSLASASATYKRLQAAVRPLTPGRLLKLDHAEMKRIGFSRQKALYTRLLGETIAKRRLNLKGLHEFPDDVAREKLTALKGIGNWTADIYLMSALRRPDIWPVGDLALAVAVQKVKRLRKRPSPERLEKMSAPWRPWRAVAARMFWHHYLSERDERTTEMSL